MVNYNEEEEFCTNCRAPSG